MTSKELLISRIDLLSEQEIISLLFNTITLMTKKNMLGIKPDCPYCGSHAIIRYGHKCGKHVFSVKPEEISSFREIRLASSGENALYKDEILAISLLVILPPGAFSSAASSLAGSFSASPGCIQWVFFSEAALFAGATLEE